MKHSKKRLRKKYSKKLIDEICNCVSQSDFLRERFFETKEGGDFDLSDSDLASAPLLHASDMAMIRKYRLRFVVTVGLKFRDSYGKHDYYCIYLCFWAKDFPGIFSESTIFKPFRELP